MNKRRPKVSIVFPVFNNEKTLVPVILEIIKVTKSITRYYEIIIIDDASTDRSRVLLKKYFSRNPNIHLFSHRINEGTAKTYKELYRKARGAVVILFSADGEWNPSDIRRLYDHMKLGADMVIGVRQKKAYRMGRKIVSFLYNSLTQLLFGVATYDAGSIKAMKNEVITSIYISSQSVFDEAERIIKASYMGYKVVTIPVSHRSSAKLKRFFPKLSLLFLATWDCVRLGISLPQRRKNFK